MAEAMGGENIEPVDEDWAGRATATVVGYVDTVRNASTGKAMVASRVAVYGLAAGLVGVMIAIIFLIFLVRLLSSGIVALLGIGDFVELEPGTVWPAYLLLGTAFLIAGLFLWRKKDR